ncbi:MAG: glycine--tRNA ligase [Planctomycetes bacterium]|nr:glycine--tRNA ligase [Planctomycetota bacterium]
MDDIVALCRRRGFIWQSSEIYGGINGFWDYGPLGAELKRNLKNAWWQDIVTCPPDGPDGHPLSIVPVDCTIIMNPTVWEASGHVGGFNDPMVDCKECKARFRADHLADLECPLKPSKKAGEHSACKLTEPREFNLMFETYCGAIRDEDAKTYLRPETAQGIFTQFWNVVDTSRVRVPFGIAQIGKAFRNEVTPRNFTFRSREFEQMEIEFFIHPDEAEQWYRYWRDSRYAWWQAIGLAGNNLQLREHDKDELAHYAQEGAGTSDIEYRFPFTAPGFGELEGVAHRADFDLKAHAAQCGKGDKMRYFDQANNDRYFPHVIEPSGGADRGTLAVLCEAYTPDPDRPSKVYMKFHPRMAPIKAAIFPLVNKDGMPEVAEKLYKDIRREFVVQFDVKQNIGKRYARMDEAGTPYCFTVDSDTLSDQTVTVRDRDTLSQERVNIEKVSEYLRERVGG